jgi:spore coat polysaccharide biosynthesis protein SpsF
MKISCIIQARTKSTRLPGKVLLPLSSFVIAGSPFVIAGSPFVIAGSDPQSLTNCILNECIARVQKNPLIDSIIIATTTTPEDKILADFAAQNKIPVYRGSENDVLSRYYNAAKENGIGPGDAVIRITSDCPFTDPGILSQLIAKFRAGGFDYVSNAMPRTYPHGLDCEIFSFDALEKAHKEAPQEDRPSREHVTYYMYNNPQEFSLGSITQEEEPGAENYRITVDTKQDYIAVCTIKALLTADLGKDLDYTWKDITSLMRKYPFIQMINEDIKQKKVFETIEEEISAAAELLRLQEMNRAADILGGTK